MRIGSVLAGPIYKLEDELLSLIKEKEQVTKIIEHQQNQLPKIDSRIDGLRKAIQLLQHEANSI